MASGKVIDVKPTSVVTKQIGPASRLGAVKSGVIPSPRRIFIYGAEGTGKSTLAANAERPIFIDADGGSADLDVPRYPFRDDEDGHIPRSFAEVMAAVADITTAEHRYRTLVMDTGDAIEKLIWQHLIERESGRGKDGELTSIESFGYGKGYTMAVDEWRALCVKLDRLRAVKKMDVIILCHAAVKNFKNPAGPDYDRWVPAINPQASGFLKGWCDIVGLLAHEEVAKAEKKGMKAKGFSTGVRVLKLAHSAAFDAKGRGNLPAEIEIPVEAPWSPVAAAIAAGHETDMKKLEEQITAEVERIGDDVLTERVEAAVKTAIAAKDSQSLRAYLNNLKLRPAKSAESQQ
jgi:AAA domain